MTRKLLLSVSLYFLSHCFYIAKFIQYICKWKKWDFRKLVELRLDSVRDCGLVPFETVDPWSTQEELGFLSKH